MIKIILVVLEPIPYKQIFFIIFLLFNNNKKIQYVSIAIGPQKTPKANYPVKPEMFNSTYSSTKK